MTNLDHILGLKQLNAEQISSILDRSDFFRKKLDARSAISRKLQGTTAVNLFFENSTRTRVSFELAEKLSGIDSVNFTGEGSSILKGESLLDTIRNLNSMKFDFFIVRHSSAGVPKLVAEHSEGKVINAGDGAGEHPTQGLLDIMTIRRIFGRIENVRVCIIGDVSHSRVAMSNIFGLLKLGASVSVCGPRSFIPRDIEGTGVKVYGDVESAVKEHDVLNILRVQLERNAGSQIASLSEFNRFYGINSERLKLNPKVKVLHPGPMNLNVEIDSFAVSSKNSYIFEQVTNGLAVRLALFDMMSKGDAR